MTHSVSTLPWQSTVLIWMGSACILLFLLSAVMAVLSNAVKQKKRQDKFRIIGGLFLFMLAIALIVSGVVGVSFLVDNELGWRLSMLGGASMTLSFVSIIALLVEVVRAKNTAKLRLTFWIWMVLFMISFATALGLVIDSLYAS